MSECEASLEVRRAHKTLDRLGVPRRPAGASLNGADLPSRILVLSKLEIRWVDGKAYKVIDL